MYVYVYILYICVCVGLNPMFGDYSTICHGHWQPPGPPGASSFRLAGLELQLPPEMNWGQRRSPSGYGLW